MAYKLKKPKLKNNKGLFGVKSEQKKVKGFEELHQKAIDEINERYKKSFETIKTEEGLKKELSFYGKVYKKDPYEKMKKFLEKKHKEDLEKVYSEIKNVADAKSFDSDLVVTVEWKKSRMWGSNPKSHTNFGFESESIGGAGYDKLSTATAQALNSDPRLLKLLYKKKNNYLKKDKTKTSHEILGYGSGYGVIPYFEGGVGVSAHQRIIEGLGLEMQNVTSTESVDVFIIKKKEKK